MKSPTGFSSVRFYPLGNGFVGRGSEEKNGILYVTVNFFDSHLKKGKELYRMKAVFQSAGKIEMLKQPFMYQTYDNKVYVAGKEGFIIDVSDHTGKLLVSINQKYEKRKFTADDEKKVRDALRLLYKQQYERLKHIFRKSGISRSRIIKFTCPRGKWRMAAMNGLYLTCKGNY
jgi:hypothetical protein